MFNSPVDAAALANSLIADQDLSLSDIWFRIERQPLENIAARELATPEQAAMVTEKPSICRGPSSPPVLKRGMCWTCQWKLIGREPELGGIALSIWRMSCSREANDLRRNLSRKILI